MQPTMHATNRKDYVLIACNDGADHCVGDAVAQTPEVGRDPGAPRTFAPEKARGVRPFDDARCPTPVFTAVAARHPEDVAHARDAEKKFNRWTRPSAKGSWRDRRRVTRSPRRIKYDPTQKEKNALAANLRPDRRARADPPRRRAYDDVHRSAPLSRATARSLRRAGRRVSRRCGSAGDVRMRRVLRRRSASIRRRAPPRGGGPRAGRGEPIALRVRDRERRSAADATRLRRRARRRGRRDGRGRREARGAQVWTTMHRSRHETEARGDRDACASRPPRARSDPGAGAAGCR